MKPKYIAAIEIGSSRIKGIVGSIDETSAITVLAIEEVDSGGTVRYGRVQNAREVSTMVNEIVRRLENNPKVAPGQISAVFVANGGRSLSSAMAEANVKLDGEAEVTQQTLERLRKEARYNLATDRDVLAIASRKFIVDNSERSVKKIIGTFGRNIHGEFTIVTTSPENRRALERVSIESHGQSIPREYLTRLLAQSEMALTDSDRALGCLFIDFGAETTTAAIFRDGVLQAAITLPMGSANITRDLSSGLSITQECAENIKVTKGQAMAERVNMQVPDDETREIINYVSARTGEIIANINNFIELAGFKPAELAAGAVIAGGGSHLKGLPEMLEAQTKLKVRPAAVDSSILMPDRNMNASHHFDVISLLRYAAAHSDISCISFPEPVAVAVERPVQATTSHPQDAYRQPAGKRKVIPGLNDSNLLQDDMDEEVVEQPDNVNEDPDLDDIKPAATSNETRKNLLRRFRDWIAPTVDNIDAEDEE